MIRLVVVAILLGCCGNVHANEECVPTHLGSADLAAAKAAAQQQVGRRIQVKVLHECRYPDEVWAYIDTVRERQPDGSDRWESLECVRPSGKSGGWHCEQFSMRVVHLGTIPKVPASEVIVPLELKTEDARALVSMIYAALPKLTYEDRCTKDPYSHPDVNALRASFMDSDPDDSELAFEQLDDFPSLSLKRNFHLVSLRPDPDHPGALRVRCWDELRLHESAF